MKSKTYYYSDELNDEFSGFNKKSITIDSNFEFIHKSLIWKICSFIAYYLFVYPVAFMYMKLKFHHKIIGKEKFKLVKNHRYYIYGNHTQAPGDGFLPAVLHFPVKPYLIVNKDNLATFGTKNILQMLGALPIPTDMHALKKFNEAMEYNLKHKHPIVIYPEAHIWPYYTKIRNFKAVSFRYPINLDLPVYCFTNVYKKGRRKTPNMITYIDGPFYMDKNLKGKEQINELRDRVYDTMCMRALNSNYEFNTYIKKEG